MTPDTVSIGGSGTDSLFPGVILESQPQRRSRRARRGSSKPAEAPAESRQHNRRRGERFDDDAEPFDGLG